MTRLWSEGEPIRMEVDGNERPLGFLWRGRRHPLQQVVQQWQVDSDWWSPEGRVWRDYLTVITTDGMLVVLYHDRLTCEWRLSKLYD